MPAVLRALNRPAALVILLLAWLAAALLASAPRATANPASSGWQMQESAGIEYAADSHGVRYPYVTLPTGGRWYLECPLESSNNTSAQSRLAPSIPLDKDHDRCGNDQGANATTYPGSRWTTSTFADVNVDPNDPRCGQLVAHRADANPPDAVGPVFCTSRVLVYPSLNANVVKALASWWPTEVLDSCPPQQELPVNPHSGLLCEGWTKGEWKNKDPAVPLQWWHKNGHGGVDCTRIPADHIPPSITAWTQGNVSALHQACAVLNNFFTGAPLRFSPSADALAAVRSALAASGPDKQPKWPWGVCCGQTSVHTSWDWQAVAATVTGCLTGGALGAAVGGPPGAVIGCAAGGYAGNKANAWMEGHDCALTSWHCIVNAVARWMAHGFISELKFALHQLTHGLAPQSLFGQDAFIRMWEALALVSAFLILLYALGAAGVAAGTLRPSIMLTTVRNILLWGWALTAAIPLTRLLLDAADGVTSFICSWAGTRSWQGLSDRFQALITAGMNASVPAGSGTVVLLTLLLLIVGAFAALWLAAWAFIRAAAIALSVLGIPLSTAALAGPPQWRRAPQLALSTLFGLILFKPLVAVVFVLGIGLMGTGTSVGAFLVGVVCILGAAFAPRHIIRLLGAGIQSVAHGEAAHTAVPAGVVAMAVGARQLYHMGRGRWHSATTGHGSRSATGGGGAAGIAAAPGPARSPGNHPVPPRGDGLAQDAPPQRPSVDGHLHSWQPSSEGGAGASSQTGTDNPQGSIGPRSGAPTVREIADRHRGGDQ